MKKVFFALSSFFFAAACSGEMNGVVRGTGEAVKINYEQGMDSDTLTAIIGNETFRGKSVMQNSSSTFGTGFGTAFGGGVATNMSTQIFSQTTTGEFVAVLLGNKGSSMSCQLRYADSTGFTVGGGVGQCVHSDSRIVDIVW